MFIVFLGMKFTFHAKMYQSRVLDKIIYFLLCEMSLMLWIEVTVQALSQEVRKVSAVPFIKEYSILRSTFSISVYRSVTNNFGQQKGNHSGVLIIRK